MIGTIEQKLYIDSLFTLYAELFTQKQKQIMEDYCFSDYSETEISINRDISRQAVHDTIKKCVKLLYEYEEKLKLHEKITHYESLLDQISKLDSLTKIRKVIKDGNI